MRTERKKTIKFKCETKQKQNTKQINEFILAREDLRDQTQAFIEWCILLICNIYFHKSNELIAIGLKLLLKR